jgi:Flp pilus assembly protein TadB
MHSCSVLVQARTRLRRENLITPCGTVNAPHLFRKRNRLERKGRIKNMLWTILLVLLVLWLLGLIGGIGGSLIHLLLLVALVVLILQLITGRRAAI